MLPAGLTISYVFLIKTARIQAYSHLLSWHVTKIKFSGKNSFTEKLYKWHILKVTYSFSFILAQQRGLFQPFP